MLKLARYRRILLALALFGLLLWAWSPAWRAELLQTQDDYEQVVTNENIRSLSLNSLRAIFSGTILGMYQPLATVSYVVDYRLGELRPGVYHASNLLIHGLNVILVFCLSRRLLANERAAWLSALLFAIWPTQVEPVVWVSCRSTLLASLFILSSLIAYDYFLSTKRRRYWLLALLAAVLAMLSKSVAVAIGPLLLLLAWYRGQSLAASLKRLWPFFLLALPFALVAIQARAAVASAGQTVERNIGRTLIMSGASFAWQAYKLLWPLELSPIYPRLVDLFKSLPWWAYLAAPSPALVLLAAWLVRRQKLLAFCLAWFVGQTLLSVMIVPYTYQIGSDRYNYLALLALIWPLAVWASCIRQRYGWRYWIMIVAALGGAAYSHSYARAWQSDFSLWEYGVRQSPGSAPAWNNYAIALMQRQQPLAALAAIETGLKFDPNKAELILNRGYIRLQLAGERRELLLSALADLERASKLQPADAATKFYLGLARFKLADYQAAAQAFDQALAARPFSALRASILLARGELWRQQGKLELACQDWQAVNDERTKSLLAQYCR